MTWEAGDRAICIRDDWEHALNQCSPSMEQDAPRKGSEWLVVDIQMANGPDGRAEYLCLKNRPYMAYHNSFFRKALPPDPVKVIRTESVDV